MIEKFFSLFKETAVHKMAVLTGVCSQIIRTFEQEYAAEPEAKDAAIDTIIQLLQKYKEEKNTAPSTPVTPTPDVPATPVNPQPEHAPIIDVASA